MRLLFNELRKENVSNPERINELRKTYNLDEIKAEILDEAQFVIDDCENENIEQEPIKITSEGKLIELKIEYCDQMEFSRGK